MKVFKYPKALPKGKRTLVLGSFSAFHNGHKKLIETAKLNKQEVVILIIEGISKLSTKEDEYTSLDIRLQQFSDFGVDYAVVANFEDIALLPGKDFLAKITKITGANTYVAGKDFAMGKGRDLKIKDVPNAIVVPTVRISDKKISTNILKELVEVGDVKLIRSLAPYYYQMNVHVDTHEKLSKINQQIPHSGVYSAWVYFNEVQYPATIHINMNKEMSISVPDFQVKNANYDPTISFVEMVRKIYKSTHDEVTKSDELKVNASLIASNNYL